MMATTRAMKVARLRTARRSSSKAARQLLEEAEERDDVNEVLKE